MLSEHRFWICKSFIRSFVLELWRDLLTLIAVARDLDSSEVNTSNSIVYAAAVLSDKVIKFQLAEILPRHQHLWCLVVIVVSYPAPPPSRWSLAVSNGGEEGTGFRVNTTRDWWCPIRFKNARIVTWFSKRMATCYGSVRNLTNSASLRPLNRLFQCSWKAAEGSCRLCSHAIVSLPPTGIISNYTCLIETYLLFIYVTKLCDQRTDLLK